MKSIWKFPIELRDAQLVQMPKGAEILSVQVQNGEIYLWAIVSIDTRDVDRAITIRGTGYEFSIERNFIGTVQIPPFVWHVFDAGEGEE